MTVADLKAKGATALGDAQLKALIVGKAYLGTQQCHRRAVQRQLHARWRHECLAHRPRRHDPQLRRQSDAQRLSGQHHAVQDRRRQGDNQGRAGPVFVAIYKLGDTYYGARSNEFGYANYEIIPYPQFVVNPLGGLLNQFSIELGLTEEQTAADHPLILQAELPKLEGAEEEHLAQALRTRLEQLKQIADDDRLPRSRHCSMRISRRSSRKFARSTGVS